MISFRKLLYVSHAIVLMITCVFNFIMAPTIICKLDEHCTIVSATSVRSIYTKAIAFACFISYFVLLRKHRKTVAVYNKNIKVCRSYLSRCSRDKPKLYNRGLSRMIACMFLILFANVFRLRILYNQNMALVILVFFLFMYIENISIFLTEAYFVNLCFQLEIEFSHINYDLMELGEQFIAIDPMNMTMAATVENDNFATRTMPDYQVTYGGDFCGSHSRRKSSSVANVVEIIRIRHRLIRDAFSSLTDLYSIPIVMSLFVLCLMALFDIYYQVYNIMGDSSRPLLLLFLWLIQYSIRFYTIVVTAHNMTAEVKNQTLIVLIVLELKFD